MNMGSSELDCVLEVHIVYEGVNLIIMIVNFIKKNVKDINIITEWSLTLSLSSN